MRKYTEAKNFMRPKDESVVNNELEQFKIYPKDEEKKMSLYKEIQSEINKNFRDLLQKNTYDDNDRKSIQFFIEEYIKSRKYFFIEKDDKVLFIEQIVNDIFGLGLLEGYINDPSVQEIWVVGPQKIYFERDGRRYLSPLKFRDGNTIVSLINKILAPINRKADESNPVVDGRLADGSRVAITMAPTSLTGPEVVIRKFKKNKFTLEDYVDIGSMSDEMRRFLITSVEAGLTMLIVGGTGSGKTTLLNALSNVIPDDRGYQHIITIEDSAELIIGSPFLSSWETKNNNSEGKGAITASDLVKHSLRNSPDRIILGEIRDEVAEDVLQVASTGHKGTMSTIHADNASEAVERFCTLTARKGTVKLEEARKTFASVFDLLVVVSRVENVKENKTERKLTQITHIVGYGEEGKSKLGIKSKKGTPGSEAEENKVYLQDVFKFDYNKGKHVCTGYVPQQLLIKAKEEGREYDMSVFAKKA